MCQTTLDYIKKHKSFQSVVVEDKQAVEACLKFAGNCRFSIWGNIRIYHECEGRISLFGIARLAE